MLARLLDALLPARRQRHALIRARLARYCHPHGGSV